MVQAYFQQLMGAACPFSSQQDFPVSLCARFQDGLDICLQTNYHRYFPQHSVVQLLNAAHQRKTLQAMLQAAQQAKDNVLAVQRVAREAMGLSQAFHVGAVAGGVAQVVGAYPSQAEQTLQRYPHKGAQGAGTPTGSNGTPGSGRGLTCFGCGGHHAWSEFRVGPGCGNQGQHIVICPNCDNPGVQEHAARQIEKMQKTCNLRHAKNLKRKNLGTSNFSNFDEVRQERIREQVLQANGDQSSVSCSVLTPRPTIQLGFNRGCRRGRGHPGGVILVADVVVLAAGLPLKHTMPISIQSNFSQILVPAWTVQIALRFAAQSIHALP